MNKSEEEDYYESQLEELLEGLEQIESAIEWQESELRYLRNNKIEILREIKELKDAYGK